MQFGLKNKEIELLKSAFKRFPQIKKVFIYGSRAQDSFKKTSDIDLAIEFKEGSKYSRALIQNVLSELPLIYTIDLLDEKEIFSTNFKREYQKNKRIFYQKNVSLKK